MSKEFITWSEIYSVNIEEIDKQHKQLIDIINKLFNAFSEGTAEAIIPEIIEELTDYTQSHFKTEEELFVKYNYPDTKKHKDEHSEFINKVEIWTKNYNNNLSNIPYELMDYLKKWLLQHILKEDKAYSKFLNEKIK